MALNCSSHTPHYEQVPFEVPESWVWTTISTFTHNLTYGTSEKSNSTGLIPVLRMGNINRKGGLDWDDLVFTSNKYDIIKYNLEYNDLLFNRTNSSDWVGKTAIYKGERKAIFAGYLIRLRTICINADYLNLVMNSSYHRDWCDEVKTDAVNQSNINAQKLSCFSVPIPPLAEQKRIVDMVASWLVLIDQIEQDQASLTTIIKQAKNKILTLAIHGKLVPQDPNDEPAIELLKRVNPNFTPCDNAQYRKLPNGWCGISFDDIFNITMGQSPDGCSINQQQGIEFHQGKLMFDNKYLRKSDMFTAKPTKLTKPYSLLLCVRAPVGVVNITQREICIGRGLCSLEPNEAINLDYAYYALTTYQSDLESKSTGSTFKAISGSIIRNEVFALPPIQEQHRIVAKIEALFAQLDNIAAAL